ncbi:MAG: MG2 domain-containing protein [Myxococcota bacterium]
MSDFLRGSPLRATAIPAVAVAAALLGCIGVCTGVPCVPTGVRYGLWLDQCPATNLRLQGQLSANSLVRGDWGNVTVHATARWLEGDGPYPSTESAYMTRGVGVDFALVDASGAVVKGLETRDVSWDRTSLSLGMKLPDVPDGDYRLRATLTTGFETIAVDAELPLYAPALVHVMSDRPLYKPGQEVLLRSAVLRRKDSAPIESRPGRWRITAPDGTEMLVEKNGTGPWGVSSTTFPLDSEADVGTWSAVYETGADSDRITFDVRPFKLPRFTVDLEPNERWYGIGDDVKVSGTARYTSGAPVARSSVTVRLFVQEGRWPMPLAWEEPVELKTDAEGHFELDLDEIPADLLETAKIRVSASVVDEAGETAVGGTTLKLSVDDLAVSAVSELRGLVANFNNRAYVRVTQPDGRPLRNAELTLRNPYDPSQPEQSAKTDADGVAAIQLDPGEPVTIVDPPPPVRVRPLTPDEPSLSSATVMPEQRSLNLAERRVLDGAHRALSACGVWAVGNTNVETALEVDGTGTIRQIVTDDTEIARCAGAAVRALRFPSTGKVATYDLTWVVPDSLQPSLRLRNSDAKGGSSMLQAALGEAAVRARRCLPRGQGVSGAEVAIGHWTVREGSRSPSILWESRPGTGLSAAAEACVRSSLGSVSLPEAPDFDAMGVTTFTLDVPQPPGTYRPQATTRTGFEFEVVAAADGSELGRTRMRFDVGDIPHLRLRASPALTSPGGTVEIEMLRGPTFTGDLPDELELYEGTVRVAKAKVNKDARTAKFEIPKEVDGFLRVEWAGARSVIFVRPENALSVGLSTDNSVYRPGETAVLTVQTKAGDQPTAAAVSLAGVDQTLSQLAPLLEPDDWGRITVRTTGEDAFGSFGPRALQLGQIQGENAALAAVLLVQNLPMDAAGDVRMSASGTQSPDETEALTTNFYRGLEALVARVRAWEKAAPASEQMQPATLAKMWSEVLAAADTPIVDAYGRPLTLGNLPPDLLVQTDPRQVVADSRRLPEDVTNWPLWVAEHPR